MSIPTGKGLLPRLPRPSLGCSEQAHQRTHQSAQPRLGLTMIGLMVVVVAVLILIGEGLPRYKTFRFSLDLPTFTSMLKTSASTESTTRPFIRGFSRIAAPLISILKISGSTESTTRPGKGGVGVGGDGGGDGGDDSGHDDEHLPRGSGRAHQQTHQLGRPGL